jgi:hypothetical protein
VATPSLIKKYRKIIKYRNCPICKEDLHTVELTQDGNNVIHFYCKHLHARNFVHYNQNIFKNKDYYNWLIQYYQNNSIYFIHNTVDADIKKTVIGKQGGNYSYYFPNNQFSINRDCEQLTQEELIALVDRLMVLT